MDRDGAHRSPYDGVRVEPPSPRRRGVRGQGGWILLVFGLLLAFVVSEAVGARHALVPSTSAVDEPPAQSAGSGSSSAGGLGTESGESATRDIWGGAGAGGGSGGDGGGSEDGGWNGGGSDSDQRTVSPPPLSPPTGPRPNKKRPRLTLNDGGEALFSLPNVAAGRAAARCVTVTYEGPRSARVRLYARTSGSLGRYLRVVAMRGRAGPNGKCSGFRPDRTNYVGRGQGVLFRGRLADFPGTFETARGRVAAPAWKPGESHVYRLEVEVLSVNAAQGRSAAFSFVWQARP